MMCALQISTNHSNLIKMQSHDSYLTMSTQNLVLTTECRIKVGGCDDGIVIMV